MIDVFYCTAAKKEDRIRSGIMEACYARWKMDPWAQLHYVTPESLGAYRKDFHGANRRFAAETAKSDVYILAEDDVMPLGNRFIERGVKILEKYGEFGVLVARCIWEPQEPEIIKCRGDGIDFMRKGAINPIMGKNPEWFDGNHQAVRLLEIGIKTGRMRDVAANHFGFRLSTVWPDDYRSGMTQIADYP